MLSRYIFTIAIFHGLISLCMSYFPQLTLYSGHNYDGDRVTFSTKRSSLTPLEEEFFRSARSYCVTGWWRGYENANFVAGSSNPFNANNVSGISCWRNGDKITKSLRFMGPSDTSTSAISAYNGVPNSGDHYSGIEVIVLATEYEASFDFAPSGLLITGMSNWTAFYERNFTGPSTCFIPTSEIYTVSLGTFQVLSVRLGCN
ncbi:uncharacterized protein LOC110850462 [Folsomia candida]|uniref:Uncharacterized protein n=1 Tax=Folsomia candida TaxID=158441 RepID=A0A226EC24_FOLCA|nr:uncharacterized protein LOC110850462 [Folsomia candida]OXA55000.1 hypothetical protein Fcan01_11262 [Folsomia candida]